LNEASLTMCKNLPSIQERTGLEQLAIEKAREAERQRIDEECTFRPDTRKAAVRGFYSAYRVPEVASADVARAAQERADRMREFVKRIEAERVAKELEQCTFKPVTNAGKVMRPPKDAPPLEGMPGMQRYIEKLVLQQDREIERKEREAEVFGYGRRWKNELTAFEPFQIGRFRGEDSGRLSGC